MGLFVEGEWTRPYEQYGLIQQKENTVEAEKFENVFGSTIAEDWRLLQLGELKDGKDTISFDLVQASKSEINRAPTVADGPLYYPFGIPSRESISISYSAYANDLIQRVAGYGSLMVFRELQEADLVGEAYPFTVDVRANGSIFTAHPMVAHDDSPAVANYFEWRPENQNKTGAICIPISLPNLTKLEFRLSRLDSPIIKHKG